MQYDFTETTLNKQVLLELISEQQIYEFYMNEDIELNKKYKSPYREDNTPSFSFILMPSGSLLWRDWGDSFQRKPEDVFSLVMKITGTSFNEALNHINHSFVLGLSSSESYNPSVVGVREIPKKKTLESLMKDNLIEVESKPFSKEDIKYWQDYYISLKMLVTYNVSSVNYCWINQRLIRKGSSSSPVYAYKLTHEKTFDNYYKIYSPLADKKGKWLSNAPANVIQGILQLKITDKLVFITKSLKDVMVLGLLGYRAVALQSETTLLTNEILDRIKYLVHKEAKFIILYDNDDTGIEKASPVIRHLAISAKIRASIYLSS